MTVRIVFETHALTTDNEAGIASGWLPGELSEEGLKGAAELGRRRHDDGIAAIYVSDLERALEIVRIAVLPRMNDGGRALPWEHAAGCRRRLGNAPATTPARGGSLLTSGTFGTLRDRGRNGHGRSRRGDGAIG